MRVCEICHKGVLIQQSGAHQYGGGWAMRATKKRKVWLPNLHAVKVDYQGTRQTMRLCTSCSRRVKAQMKKVEGSKKETKEILIVPKVKEPISAVVA